MDIFAIMMYANNATDRYLQVVAALPMAIMRYGSFGVTGKKRLIMQTGTGQKPLIDPALTR
jgi:hypothetical protein